MSFWVANSLGRVCIGTHSEVQAQASDPYRHMLGLLVDDLDAEYRRLRAASVVVLEGPTRYTRARMAPLVDPEGNILQLYQAEPEPIAAPPERRAQPHINLDRRFSCALAGSSNWSEASVRAMATARSSAPPRR